ncbi:MAG: agmatine deiminase family protein [Gammaproteobacteria bacterium]
MTLRLPAEWEPQSGILLTWPHEQGDWEDIDAAHEQFVRIAEAIARFETVHVCARDETWRRRILSASALQHAQHPILISCAQSNDVWARDHGPITVFDRGAPRLLDFEFNGWGDKFQAELDNALTRTLHRKGLFGTTPLATVNTVLEGGAIDSDGNGRLLVRRSAVLTETRNPNLDQMGFERLVAEFMGIKEVLWLEHGDLLGDDTDGHVDTLARFCSPQSIAYQACDIPADPHHAPLVAMEGELRALRTPTGEPYHLFPLPLPSPILDTDGRRLPAGYANFLICNDAVLMPTYDDAADDLALAQLRKAFPAHTVIGVDCRTLIGQNGSLHCTTMQVPDKIELFT